MKTWNQIVIAIVSLSSLLICPVSPASRFKPKHVEPFHNGHPSGAIHNTSDNPPHDVSNKFGKGKAEKNLSGNWEYIKASPHVDSPFVKYAPRNDQERIDVGRRNRIVNNDYLDSLLDLRLITADNVNNIHKQILLASTELDRFTVAPPLSYNWLLKTMGFRYSNLQPKDKSSPDVSNTTARSNISKFSNKLFSTKTLVMMPEANAPSIRNVLFEGKADVPVSQTSITAVQSAAKSFTQLRHTDVINNPKFSIADLEALLINISGSFTQVVIVGHSPDVAGPGKSLVLPNGIAVPFKDIHEAGLNTGIVTIIMSCHSPDLNINKAITYNDALWMCRSLDYIHDIQPCMYFEGVGKSIKLAQRALKLKSGVKTTLYIVVIGGLGGLGYTQIQPSSELNTDEDLLDSNGMYRRRNR